MLNINWDEVDKPDIRKSIELLDLFTKIYCRYRSDYQRFGGLKFRCDECPFSKPDGKCTCEEFIHKYASDFKDFRRIGEL